MLIMRKSAYAAAAIIGAAALTATITTSARANSWDYGYGYGTSSVQAHGVAVMDLLGSYSGCIDLTNVSDTRGGDGTWYAVVKGFCGAPR